MYTPGTTWGAGGGVCIFQPKRSQPGETHGEQDTKDTNREIRGQQGQTGGGNGGRGRYGVGQIDRELTGGQRGQTSRKAGVENMWMGRDAVLLAGRRCQSFEASGNALNPSLIPHAIYLHAVL